MTNKKSKNTYLALGLACVILVMMSQFGYKTEAESEDWIERIIGDTPSTVTSVAIGDADNDGKNEIVIGMWGSANELRIYEKLGSSWIEDVIATLPVGIYSVAIGDSDNNGTNEVVIGLSSTTNELRKYQFSSGSWNEEIIADTPNNVYSVVIGDADKDGSNEVVIGLHSSIDEVRSYEKSGGVWIEDVIVDAPSHVRCVAIGDADCDGNNEVVIGMDSTTNELRTYEYISGSWMEEVIADTPNNVYSVAIGDANNDGDYEVVIGLHSSSDEVRCYKKSGLSWVEDVIADTPTNVRSVAIGDADKDGNNEVAIGMVSTLKELRTYENNGGVWIEDIIAETPTDVYSVAIGDADNDCDNEVVIGLLLTTNEVRLYDYDLGAILFTSLKDGDYVMGTICIDVAVSSGSVEEVNFYLNNELEHTDDSHPYQYILDTTTLIEDSIYTVKAAAITKNNSSICATLDIVINNIVQTGDFITVSTLKNSYEPDQEVSVIIGTTSPPSFESLNLIISYTDPCLNILHAINESMPYSSQYIVGLPLHSDAILGIYTLKVDAYGYDNGVIIWNATGIGSFEVIGSNIHEQLGGINNTLFGMNTALNDIQSGIMDIQSGLGFMNLSDLLNAISHLNQTLPEKIDEVTSQLSSLNESLLCRISSAETDIMSGLDHVNTSLSSKIQSMIVNITDEIGELNGSISDELANIFGDLKADNDALSTWLEIVLEALDANMTQTKNTILSQLTDLECHILNYNDSIRISLEDILSELEFHDERTGQNHTEIKNIINDMVVGGIGSTDLEEMKTILFDLAEDIHGNNQSIANDISSVALNIESFEDETSRKLEDINTTLQDLAKLDTIIADLNAMDQSLESVENEAKNSKEMQGFNYIVIIIFLTLMLIILLMGAYVLIRENRMLKEALDGVSGEHILLEVDNISGE